MNLKSVIGKAAQVPSVLFSKISSNPDNQNNPMGNNYIDLIYERDYKKIRHYKDYREMMKDPQVKVGLSILQMFFMSREFHVTPAPEDQDIIDTAKAAGTKTQNQLCAEFIEDQLLNNNNTPFRNVRKNIYTALPYGFSAQEFVYELTPEGLIGIKGMYPIHRKTLDHRSAFKFDDNDELISLNQQFLVGPINSIPIEKVLLYSFDSEFNDPHGNSFLDEIYDNVYMKRKNLKGLAIFIEKHASPFLLGKVSQAKFKDKMREQMEEVSEGRTQMTVGVDDDISIMESSKDGSAFFTSVQYHDNTIFKRMFIGTLMMGQMNDSGSLSQSQTQIEITRMLLDGVHEEIAGGIQNKTDEIAGWNFATADPPKVSFEKFEDKDILALMAALNPYIQSMVLDSDSDWFSQIVSMAVKEYSGIDVDPDSITESSTPEVVHVGETATVAPAPVSGVENQVKAEDVTEHLSSMMPSNQD